MHLLSIFDGLLYLERGNGALRLAIIVCIALLNHMCWLTHNLPRSHGSCGSYNGHENLGRIKRELMSTNPVRLFTQNVFK